MRSLIRCTAVLKFTSSRRPLVPPDVLLRRRGRPVPELFCSPVLAAGGRTGLKSPGSPGSCEHCVGVLSGCEESSRSSLRGFRPPGVMVDNARRADGGLHEV